MSGNNVDDEDYMNNREYSDDQESTMALCRCSTHLSLLATLRGHLKSPSDEGSASASVCLRSLNWDFLDTIMWPVFLVEYLLFHSPKYIPGSDLDEFKPFETMAEIHNWKSRYFNCKVKKTVVVAEDGTAKPCMVEEYNNELVIDGNGDECYLCRTMAA